MQLQRSLNTGPEVALRQALHRRGLRFRLQRAIVPGTRRLVDIVFGPARVAVDVRGCYWHGHDHELKAYERRRNLDYWVPKIAGNALRDADTEARLRALGWELIVVWECEDLESAVERVIEVIASRRELRPRAPAVTG